MDIRSFFKAGAKSGGGAPPKKPKQEVKASQEAAPARPPPPAAAKPASKASTPAKRSSSQPSGGGSSQGRSPAKAKGRSPAKAKGTPAKAGKGAAAAESRKRKKAAADSDSDVEVLDDDSDDDFEAISLDEEDDDDVIAISDDDSGEEPEPKPKPAKRAKPSPAAAAASKAKAGSTPAKKGRGKKADRPAMVIEKGTQDTAEKKRKLPGSMAGQIASQVAAPGKPAAKTKSAAAALSDDAKKAMKLVEAAAAQLPDVDKDSLTFAPSGMFGGAGMEDRAPANPGGKDVTHGHADAFTGKAFVFTGVLDSLYRDAAKDLVLSHGGRVTTDVSGKTSFLVVGDQCSRRKFEKAVEKGCKVIDEDGLLALTAASAALVPQTSDAATAEAAAEAGGSTDAAAAGAAAAAAGQPAAAGTGSQQAAGRCSSQQQQQQLGGSSRGATAVPVMISMAFHGGSGGAASAGPSRVAAAAAAGAALQRPAGGNVSDTLWVEKYKPKTSQDLVGNQSNVQSLRQWLHQWEDVHLRGATPVQPRTGGYQAKPKDMTKKAVLLSGPPGIGKTSSAHIVAREEGFQVVEVNASDARSKSDNKATTGMAGKLSNVVREMVTSTALAAASGVKRRQVLVMDEVDGMSAGDRGGVADLINTIKMSKIPIICICNDKYAQKLRSLRNHCLELDFRKPQSQQIAARMAMVCQQEGLDTNEATLRTLIEGGQGDLRLVLGQLQMARLRANRLDFAAAKGMSAVSKDADMSPFNACSRLFEAPRQGDTANPPSLMDKMEWVFSDADLVPLLVQENYANYMPDLARGASRPDMLLRTLAKAADAISIGDVINGRVRRYGNWGLMPFGTLVGSVTPARYMAGTRVTYNEYEQNFTRFSAWFGNYSHSNKQQRLLAELSCAMAAGDTGATCSRSSVRMDYLPALRQVLTRPLQTEGEAAIQQVITVMQSYCINREQFDFVLDVTKFKSKGEWAEDPMKGIDTKTKSAFTRTFNKQGLKPKTAAMVGEVNTKGKGKGRGKAAAAAAAGEEEEEVADAVAGDAEGGAALAEEGGAPRKQARVSEDAEEDGLDPDQLAARMRQDGISLELKAPAAAGKSGGGRGGASGRGRGERSGGAASGRGAGGRSGGRGRGRGK